MDILKYIGSFVCHQMAERSFEVGGRFLPLCSRCTGIYGGFLAGIVYRILTRQVRSKELPAPGITATCVLFIVVLVVQSIGSYFDLWRDTSNVRFILGLLGGSSISILLLPTVSFFLLTGPGKERVTTSYSQYAILLALVGLMCMLPFIDKAIIAHIIAILSVGGLVILYLMINTVIATMMTNWRQRKHNIKSVLLLSGLVLILFVIEGSVLRKIHQ